MGQVKVQGRCGDLSLPSEVAAAAGVDHGVHRGVDPAQPREDGEGQLRVWDAAWADAWQREGSDTRVIQELSSLLFVVTGNYVGNKERKPADDEHPHYCAKRLGRFCFFGEL